MLRSLPHPAWFRLASPLLYVTPKGAVKPACAAMAGPQRIFLRKQEASGGPLAWTGSSATNRCVTPVINIIPTYLWGDDLHTFFALGKAGHTLVSNIHADDFNKLYH